MDKLECTTIEDDDENETKDMLCRVCGSVGNYRLFGLCYKETTISDMLQECSKIQVLENDMLPSTICKSCIKEIVRCFEFIETCNQSFEMFLGIANKLDGFISRTTNQEQEIETDFLSTLRAYFDEFISSDEIALEPNIAGIVMKLKTEYICRVCMSKTTLSIFDVQYKKYELAQLYEECTSLKIKQGDDLPQYICQTCMNELVHNYEFKTICEESCNTFLKAIQRFPSLAEQFKDARVPEILTIKTEDGEVEEVKTVEEINVTELFKEKETTANGKLPNYCEHCDTNYPTFKDLTVHRKLAIHPAALDHECMACQKTFMLKNHLVEHMKLHSATQPFVCSLCSKGFSVSGNLKRHMRVHTGHKPFACEFCGKAFIQLITLQTHLQHHSNSKKYKCCYCDRHFFGLTACRNHERSHTSDGSRVKEVQDDESVEETQKTGKSYKCATCGKILASRNSFQIHLNMHMGVRPYTCRVCKKSFTQSTGLRNHMRIHSGEKPHVCTFCKRAFTQSSQLGYHLKTHSGEKSYACRFCSKAFALKGNLVVHERIHTGEAPYSCMHCEKGFTNSSALKKHKRAVHGMYDKETIDDENVLKHPMDWEEDNSNYVYEEELNS